MKEKVVDFIKRKREDLAHHQFEFKDWLSPTIRDYWVEFLNKANNSQIASWVKDHSLVSVANDNAIEVEKPEPIEMHPEAQKLMNTLTATLGEEIHVGEWLTVEQSRINHFADVTEDHQWIHTDPERAQTESPFKTTIAHGFLTLSLLSVLTDSVDPKDQKFPTAKMTVNYGLNQVRFPYPVKSGVNVRARTKIQSVTPIKRGLEIVQEITVEIEGCRRPGCVAESVVRLYF
ncbi:MULTISPECIES: MaoC family dehydratase [unclassified Photobacterium]|uniref:MaoC family dehydratase n=1 Tax=unclassified Photobacterium TaxID=2628852 RepID=UPI000D16BDB4|nr:MULTISPECIES: MaoC family dehydratase [unclassified Photobacterium]PSV27827.1 dehydratase [Photobacterium sp. GB-56]PSV32031.1 dehydratase [Photobacterium sp. GB-72]PSV32759.1 dehydratase [Photobacterium sp. GB-27]PSV38469.1 dehydratase [Photobacterium sp. GB-210]PSV41409.1 dehydratase [Photobacterium sp. GB-36]